MNFLEGAGTAIGRWRAWRARYRRRVGDLSRTTAISDAVAASEARFRGDGRVVLRVSGTEPVVRVMVEGADEALVRSEAESLARVVALVASGS